ncbi:MAG: alpha/beta hydrolase-fold protein [Mucilaginibacter sp.]
MLKRLSLLALIASLTITQLCAQVNVTFKTGKLPNVKDAMPGLFLAGDFNDWNPGDTNWQLQGSDKTYSLTKKLSPGMHNLKVTKGSWDGVESNLRGQDVANREYKITNDTTIILNIDGWKDGFIPEPVVHTISPNVKIITEQFNMPQLMRQRRVWIYLPSDYATSKRKYPVIYMHDGQNLFDQTSAGYGEWGVDEIVDKFPVAKQCIIVGIDHGGNERISEYNPYDSKYGKGKGSLYVDFLVRNLKPYIDDNYRTQSDAQHTTIAGSSMGGLISTYAVLKYPNVFGTAGVFSPAYWLATDIFAYAEKQQLNSYNRFYFACGDAESKEMVPDMEKMAAIVKAKGNAAKLSPVIVLKGEKHNEKQWNGSFPGFYEWVGK